MVLHCPLGVPSGTANAGRPKRGVAHAQHSKLGWQAVQIHTDTVEVGIGGAPSQGGSDGILGGSVLRDRLLQRIQQNGVDVGQLSEHSEESRKFRRGPSANGSRNDLVLNRRVRLRVEGIENVRDKLPRARRGECVGVAVNVGLKVVRSELLVNYVSVYPSRSKLFFLFFLETSSILFAPLPSN